MLATLLNQGQGRQFGTGIDCTGFDCTGFLTQHDLSQPCYNFLQIRTGFTLLCFEPRKAHLNASRLPGQSISPVHSSGPMSPKRPAETDSETSQETTQMRHHYTA